MFDLLSVGHLVPSCVEPDQGVVVHKLKDGRVGRNAVMSVEGVEERENRCSE